MKKYRKKPVIIEAEQWFKIGDVPEAKVKEYMPNWLTEPCSGCGKPLNIHGNLKTLEGWHIVCPGDWIIKGVKGGFYPIKPDIFEQTYEEV